jgi:predicted NBD/HSP70 family sugar kinase
MNLEGAIVHHVTVTAAGDQAGRPSRAAYGLGHLVSLVAEGKAATRADLSRLTGLARSTVSQRVELLVRSDVLRDTGDGPSTGGRRPTLLKLAPGVGVVLAADIGATHCRLAIADLTGRIAADVDTRLAVASGPEAVLGWVIEGFRQLLRDAGLDAGAVRAVGIGVPGPVEFATGTVVQPPIMPGWDGLVMPEWFADHFDAPVLVDNDVNIMALGEYSGRGLAASDLLFVKVSTGIGCGIISDGRLHRGADGAAGDIGHVRVTDGDDTVCTCGNTGCLEAVASGAAVARRLARDGLDARTARDVVELAKAGDARAARSVRLAGERIGEVVAALVNFYNPSTIVIGGALSELRDDLLAGIRGVVYHRALPLATRHLTIETTRLGRRAGVLGASVLAATHALSPAGMTALLRAHGLADS